MWTRQKNRRSSHFDMGEDVHLLSKSVKDLNTMDEDTRRSLPKPTSTSFHTPVATAQKIDSAVAIEKLSRPPANAEHHRLVSVSTILSSILGFSADGSVVGEKTGDQHKRVRIKGMYGFVHRDLSKETNVLLIVCFILVVLYSVLICVGPMLLTWVIPKRDWCGLDFDVSTTTTNDRQLFSGDTADGDSEGPYANPDYILDPCRYLRVPHLCFFTMEECDMSRRLLCSVILGGIIGYERRSSDRPAGIRTMGLVSLGACSFTISSIMAFKSSTMGWDASRVTAALPSGVGFLGGALIWKGSVFINDEEIHQVNGLTTAASVWLSAAVGVGCGGALYLVTTYVVIMVVMILRYAPRSYVKGLFDEPEGGEEELDENYDDQQEAEKYELQDPNQHDFGVPQNDNPGQHAAEEEGDNEAMDRLSAMTGSATRASSRTYSVRVKDDSSSSFRMMKSRSAGNLRASLRASVRAQVPTFAD